MDDSATGANDGSSWTDAFVDLQVALDEVQEDDEIRVAQGVYWPTAPNGSRETAFAITTGPVTITGGFAGVGADNPDERNIELYKTVLSGDLNGNDACVSDASELEDEPTRNENSHHVVTVYNGSVANGVVLDGLTITGGNANGESYLFQSGGGIESRGPITIRNCIIENNSAKASGGGCSGGVILFNCVVRNNSAPHGGGLQQFRKAWNCIIEQNVAHKGGGIYGPSMAAMVDCVIRYNRAHVGGGVWMNNELMDCQRCAFIGNEAVEQGGAIWIWNDCTCRSELNLFQCRMQENKAGQLGGGLYHGGNSRVEMYSCLIGGNSTGEDGGGIYCFLYQGMIGGGFCRIVNSTIFHNIAELVGGGINCKTDSVASFQIVNSILWDNQDQTGVGTEPAQIRFGDAGSTGTGTGTQPDSGELGEKKVDYCCIQGFTGLLGGSGNQSQNPSFTDSDGLDGIAGSLDDDLHLLPDSPCINTGDPDFFSGIGTGTGDMCCAVDLDGNPRCLSGRVDMGAYESFGPVVWYVDDDANSLPIQDGLTWSTALTYLQDALMLASEGDEIHVAQGVYKPDDFVLSDRVNQGRAETFQLKKGVTIRGGYAGLSGPEPNARDIAQCETILSGDLSDTLETLTNENFYQKLVDRGSGSYSNSMHVVTAVDVDSSAVLDGVTITGGTANGFAYGEWSEAKNYHGGGVYIESASPTLIDCTITGNVAFVYNGPAAMGGGMYCLDGDPTLIRCSFLRNVADDFDSDAFGAGMANEDSSPTFIGCLFDHNRTYNWGGGMANSGDCHIQLRDCVFSDNFSQYGGGGIWDNGAGGDLEGCVFRRNVSMAGGGMFLAMESFPWRISHSVFSENQAEWAGGLDIEAADVQISHCTIAYNHALDQWGGLMDHSGAARFTSSIFWGNTCDNTDIEWAQIGRNDGNTRFDYCCVQGWTGQFTGVGTIDVDPLFVDPVAGDYYLRSQAGRWDPQAKAWVQDAVTSPCIDAGDPASPIMHEPFPNGGIVNRGAYGGTVEASKSYFEGPVCEVIVAGDINGDCRVNLIDLALMARHWLEDQSNFLQD
ncbi:MAG: hypothetical protein JW828_07750 [Sedimentisphaerales bacterium]|nr:hypothetical protein [Sedimentisphaerales bacterium]